MNFQQIFHYKKRVVIGITSAIFALAVAGVFLYSGKGFDFDDEIKPTASIDKVYAPAKNDYDEKNVYPQALRIVFDFPAAAAEKIGTPLEDKIEISPEIRGKWQWKYADILQFMPENSWIPDTVYKVMLNKNIFSPNVDVKDLKFTFSSPEFEGKVTNAEFYEDPRDAKNKSIAASFSFSYPVETADIKKYVKIYTVGGKAYDFTYKLSNKNTELYIISEPVKIEDEEDFANIVVDKILNAYNHKPLKEKIKTKVKIPSNSTFFKLVNADSFIVRNQKNNNPEQIFEIEFSAAANSKKTAEAISLNYVDYSCYKVGTLLDEKGGQAKIEQRMEKLSFVPVSDENENLKKHLFKYNTEHQTGCLIALLDNGLTSADGYSLDKKRHKITAIRTRIAQYPIETNIAGTGSLISLQGSRKVALISRGAKEIEAKVSRIDTADLNHLITQTYGRFSDPQFSNYDFNDENIAEIFHKTLPINLENLYDENYASIDLDEYFQNRKGVFLLTVKGSNDDRSSSPDRRLLVMTDLGIVVKDNADKTHEVFISDIAKQKPVAGATIQVLGKNGIAVLSVQTDENGVAKLPDFSAFKNEKRAVVYKVSKNDDISFMPISYEREVNMSRFDVGGDYDSDETMMKGYIFSDRGIYRPKESVNLGILVRQNDLNAVQNMPFILEIYKPSGDIVATKNLKANEYGFMEYTFELSELAPTGSYIATLQLKEKDGQKKYVTDTSFIVREFAPDTLKIKAKWDMAEAKGWSSQSKISASINLQNLYGIAAAGHVIKSDYSLMPTSFDFPQFGEYVFQNPLQNAKLRSYKGELKDLTTDKDGNAKAEIDLLKFERGTYILQLNIDGMEAKSGRGVSTNIRTSVSPEQYLVGWKTDGQLDYVAKNAERKVSFIAIDNNLQQIEKNNLLLQLSKIEYVSTLMEKPNGTYEYQTTTKENVILQKQFAITEKGSEEVLKTDEAGRYILRVVDENNQPAAKIEYMVSGAENSEQKVDKDASLTLKLNKKEYNTGDLIKMQIGAPYSGYGLITIERDKVYAYKWFEAKTSSVEEEIELPDTVEGNAYINVAFFRGLDSKQIYMPSLSYAAAPFNINRDARKLEISLDVPQIVKSGQELKIKYKTSEPSSLVIYGVNEGILQVARYKMPNLLNIFMGKKALRVITLQIMDLIMPDADIIRSLSSTGGDDAGEEDALKRNLNPFARKTDKPVAFWSSIIQSDENGGEYTYVVPAAFNGKIKVMAVAASAEKFGNAQKETSVRSDYVITPSGPYNVAPGDEFVVGVGVANLSGKDDDIRVSLTTGKGTEIVGEAEQTISLKKDEEKQLEFRLRATNNLGSEEIMFAAQSVNDTSKRSVMPYSLSIRPIVPFNSYVAMGFAKSSYGLSGVEDMYEQYRSQTVSASTSPLVLAKGMLQYLNKYPHYCTEQTVSKVFPAMELFFKSPELVKNIDVYALFEDAIRILRDRQKTDGGFSSWSTSSLGINVRDSLYAAHFLVMADKHGLNVPSYMLESALSYCKIAAAEQPKNSEDYAPSYAAYILTVSGEITTNYLLKIQEFYQEKYPHDWEQSIGAQFLAASYKMLQNEKLADKPAGKYKNGKNEILNAMNIYLLASHFPQKMKMLDKKSIEELIEPLKDGNFTTYSAGWSVLALNAFESKISDKNIKFSEFVPEYTPFPTVAYNPQTKDLRVSSDQPFYYVNSQLGFVKTTAVKPLAKGLEVEKTYYDAKGQKVQNAKLGDELLVEVKYRSLDKPVYDVALVDLISGCFDIVPGSLITDYDALSSEIREDRVNVYVSAYPEPQKFTYKVKVVAGGKFALPPVYASAMYQPFVRANSASGIIEIE